MNRAYESFRGIKFEVIPHASHRYETVGDYWWDNQENDTGFLNVRVSVMSDWRYVALVFFHEVIEALLCKLAGVREVDIKAFDEMYGAEREEGKHTIDEEPGHDDRAPYRKQHVIAESLERVLAIFLGVDWRSYDLEVMSL